MEIINRKPEIPKRSYKALTSLYRLDEKDEPVFIKQLPPEDLGILNTEEFLQKLEEIRQQNELSLLLCNETNHFRYKETIII